MSGNCQCIKSRHWQQWWYVVQAGAAGKSDENSLVESCQSKHSIVSTSWMWFLSCLVGVQFIPHHTDSAASATRLVGWPHLDVTLCNFAIMKTSYGNVYLLWKLYRKIENKSKMKYLICFVLPFVYGLFLTPGIQLRASTSMWPVKLCSKAIIDNC